MTIIGKTLDYQDQPTKNITRIRRGTVVQVRKSAAVILDTKTGESQPAYEVKLQPINGDRAFWTRPMGDRGSLAASCSPVRGAT